MTRPRGRLFRLPWRTPDADVEDELRSHIEERIEDLVALGSTPSAARAQAESELGDRAALREELVRIDQRIAHKQSRLDQIELLSLPFRFALRRLLRQPGYLVLASGSLALALGATTATIGFADAWNHPTIAFEAPDQTAAVMVYGGPLSPVLAISTTSRWQRIAPHLPIDAYALAAYQGAVVRVGDEVLREPVLNVSANFTAVTGVRLARGRGFIDGPADENAVLVSEYYWRRYFGNRDTTGDATIMVGDRSMRIVGVMPRSPMWPVSGNVFRLATGSAIGGNLSPVVRLSAGATWSQLQQKLDALTGAFNEDGGLTRPYRLALRPFSQQMRTGLDSAHTLMLTAAVVVLLIACANLTALLLARLAARRRDVALRLSLGASRAAIFSDVLAELIIIALVGLVAGFGLANGATGVVRALLPLELTWATSVEMHWSWRVFAMSGGLLLFVVFVVGLLPSLEVLRTPLMEPLKESSGGAVSRRPQRMTSVVMLQLAASLLMLIVTGAHLTAAAQRERLSFGFDARRVLLVAGELTWTADSVAAGLRNPTEYVLASTKASPGITAASYYASAKPEGSQVTSEDPASLDHPLLVDQYTIAGPGFLNAAGIALLRGRDIAEGDSVGAGAVILDESAARALFPGGDALGRRVRMGRASSAEPWRTVVGIARDVALRFPPTSLPARSPAIYVATSLPRPSRFAIAARIAGSEDAAAVTQRVRRDVAAVLPYTVLVNTQRLADRYDTAARAQWQLAALFGALAIGALLFAGAGLFAVLSYRVNQRMRELAVRVAVGATARDVAWLVARDTAQIVLGGTAIGGTAGLLFTYLFSGPVFGVEGTSASALVAGELILVAVAALAAVGPTLKAMRADPTAILRVG